MGRGATGRVLGSATQTTRLGRVWASPQVLVRAGQSLRDRVSAGQASLPHLFLTLRTQQMDLE